MTSTVKVGMRTPWGAADAVEVLGEGVGVVFTPSHGGVKLDAKRNKLIPVPLRREGGWYEEDCEAYFPMYVMPELFVSDKRPDPAQVKADAKGGILRWYPEEFAAAYPDDVPPDPAPRTDDEIDAALAEPVTPEEQDALDGQKCGTCKGLGLVRKHGKRAGEAYRTLAGAQAALGNGNAADCPTCKGTGIEAAA